jgi:hypothetical protein
MSNCHTVDAKYVFLDIVGYTHNRSIEAQVQVIDTLNTIVRKHIDGLNVQQVILLPTGDGMCVGLIGAEFDVHIELATSIIDDVFLNSMQTTDPQNQFQLRIGVNQNTDNLVTDINGRSNLAGDGINMAQRIMSMAEPGKIMVSQSVHDTLNQRRKYMGKFKRGDFAIKHGNTLVAYEYQYNPGSAILERQGIGEALFGRPLFNLMGVYEAAKPSLAGPHKSNPIPPVQPPRPPSSSGLPPTPKLIEPVKPPPAPSSIAGKKDEPPKK